MLLRLGTMLQRVVLFAGPKLLTQRTEKDCPVNSFERQQTRNVYH
jgi:hypothetical protein